MFKFLKKTNSNCTIKAPISGQCISLEDVNDDMFSTKMLGDGVAIDATGEIVCAPADGVITAIVATKHAFAMKLKNGVEVLIHIGIETVSLNGEGFTVLANVDDEVKQGAPIIKIDRNFIESKGMSLITPVIIVGEQEYELKKFNVGNNVAASENVIMECKLKS